MSARLRESADMWKTYLPHASELLPLSVSLLRMPEARCRSRNDVRNLERKARSSHICRRLSPSHSTCGQCRVRHLKLPSRPKVAGAYCGVGRGWRTSRRVQLRRPASCPAQDRRIARRGSTHLWQHQMMEAGGIEPPTEPCKGPVFPLAPRPRVSANRVVRVVRLISTVSSTSGA